MADGKEPGADVPTPELDEKGGSFIRVKAVEEPENGQEVEYAISRENAAPSHGWGEELLFEELTASRTYYIFARAKKNEQYYVGAPSAGLQVKTKAASGKTQAEGGKYSAEGSLWGAVSASASAETGVSVAASLGEVSFGGVYSKVGLGKAHFCGAGAVVYGYFILKAPLYYELFSTTEKTLTLNEKSISLIQDDIKTIEQNRTGIAEWSLGSVMHNIQGYKSVAFLKSETDLMQQERKAKTPEERVKINQELSKLRSSIGLK